MADQEPRYRLIDGNDTPVGSVFWDGSDMRLANLDTSTQIAVGNGVLDVGPNDLRLATGQSIEDGSGNNRLSVLSDNTFISDGGAGKIGISVAGSGGTDIQLTDGLLNVSNASTNLRLATGQSIEDGSGGKRFEVLSGLTRIRGGSSGVEPRIQISDKKENVAVHTGTTNNNAGFEVFDETGNYTPFRYITSSNPPGTLDLTNALVNHTVSTSTTNDSMTADPETDTEDGFITVEVDGTEKQIPVYDP